MKHWNYSNDTYIKVDGKNVNLNSEDGIRLVESLYRRNQELSLKICELETRVSQIAGKLGHARRRLKELDREE